MLAIQSTIAILAQARWIALRIMAPSLSELIASSVEEAGVEPSEMQELLLDGHKGWTMDPAGLTKLGELTELMMLSMSDWGYDFSNSELERILFQL